MWDPGCRRSRTRIQGSERGGFWAEILLACHPRIKFVRTLFELLELLLEMLTQPTALPSASRTVVWRCTRWRGNSGFRDLILTPVNWYHGIRSRMAELHSSWYMAKVRVGWVASVRLFGLPLSLSCVWVLTCVWAN